MRKKFLGRMKTQGIESLLRKNNLALLNLGGGAELTSLLFKIKNKNLNIYDKMLALVFSD